MINQGEQKKMLIQSMKKLTGHVTGNPHRQKDIFDALSLHDFNKILANLKDQNQYLRRISALFLCELFFGNEDTKGGAVRLLGLQPGWGRICLGGFPQSVVRYPSTLKKCVELMHHDMHEEQNHKICWIINLQRKNLKLQTLDYKKYSSFTFIDPNKHIFGFTIPNPNQPPPPKKQTTKRYSIGGKVEQKDFKNSVDNYKNFFEQKQQQKQKEKFLPKNSLNMTLQSERRNSTSSSSSQYQTQLGRPHRKTQYNKTMELKSPKNEVPFTSTATKQQTPRSYKPSPIFSPKVSLTQASDTPTHQFSASYYDKPVNGSGRKFGVLPSSARQSHSREQQKFYRRVKDIMKK